MAVSIYKANQFRILAGKKIYQNNAWKTMPDNARIYLNGTWHYLSGRAATAYLVSATNNELAALMPVDQAEMGDIGSSGDPFCFVNAGNLYSFSNGSVSSPILPHVTSLIGGHVVSGGEVYTTSGNIISRYGAGWTAFDSWGCSGIKNGNLYDSAGNLMLSSVSNWQPGEYQSQYTADSYAITNGMLYYYYFSEADGNLYRGYAAQVGISSSWTAISRYGSGNVRFTYGINNGILYKLQRAATVIDSSGTWTAVDGDALSNGSSCCRGVRDGQLCRVSTDGTVTVMDSRTGWTLYSEVFAICEGKLYNISGNTPVQIGSWSDWIDMRVSRSPGGHSIALRRTAV